MAEKIKTALVTGASGFIGKALVHHLIARGVDVVAVDMVPCREKILCRFVVADMTQPHALDDLLDRDTVIFHMAAHANVADSVKDPEGDFKNNLGGLIEVLGSARRRQCRVIFPSTASIFDTTNSLPVSEHSYVKPSSPYAAAKAAGEAYCFTYQRCYGIDVRIARMFSVYGVGMNRFVIHDTIQKIKKDRHMLRILGDGEQIRDYLYIDDAVEGLVTIAANGRSGEDYNLASGIPVRIFDLARKIAGLMGCPDIHISPSGESFPGDVPKWFASIEKIKQIGFRPTISLEDGLQRTIRWLVNQHG